MYQIDLTIKWLHPFTFGSVDCEIAPKPPAKQLVATNEPHGAFVRLTNSETRSLNRI